MHCGSAQGPAFSERRRTRRAGALPLGEGLHQPDEQRHVVFEHVVGSAGLEGLRPQVGVVVVAKHNDARFGMRIFDAPGDLHADGIALGFLFAT